MKPSNDEVLLDLLASDLDRHFELLLRTYGNTLYSYVYQHIRNTGDTEDIMQDTALRIYTALRSYSQEQLRDMGTRLRPWLYKVAKSAYLTYIEKQKRFISVSLDGEDETFLNEESFASSELPEQILEREETRNKIVNLVAELPAKYREVIYLHYFDEFKLFEISDILQEPEGTVRQKKRRALALLQKAISREQKEVL
jgi:RNA polymerase sigma-70 factor, ECF subfamily